jgi:Asp-tRNA(Asn)/Glu-tRNA(Gln) amidotransferase A subunit family amidase
MPRLDELLEPERHRLEQQADRYEQLTGLDRRQFLFRSLIAAAAGTLATRGAYAQVAAAGAAAATAQQAPQVPPVPLGNGEPPAITFQAYPGGTSALVEKLLQDRGAEAFVRTPFEVEPWNGQLPRALDTIAFLPAHRLSTLLKEGRISSSMLTDLYLERLKRLDPVLQCAVTILEDQARAEARRADEEIAAGRYRGALHGLPYGIKDLFAAKGAPTTWGSRDFEHRVIDEDSEMVARLREAGAVLIAKLATGLFANNDWWYRGRTNNPWDVRRGSSGSSAGPASATAAGCVAFAIGTETSGSIVSPSRECGLSALRPTFGRVSRYGAMTLSWSRDRVGPICRTIEDCAMVFDTIHGVDVKDPSTISAPFRFDRSIDLSALRIGYADNAPQTFLDKLRELGADPFPIGARPQVPGAGAGGGEGAAAFDFYVQMLAEELKVDLNALPEAPPPGRPGDPSKLESLRSRVGQRAGTALDFIQGQRRRYFLMQRMSEFMRGIDMYVQPETGGPDIGLHAQTGHPCAVVPYKFERPTANVGGAVFAPPEFPAPPAGTVYNEKPICAVIAGNLFNDDLILSVAHKYQVNTDWHLRRPQLPV